MATKLRVEKWYHWPAVGFGSGLIAKAPGTWGSVVAIPFWLLFADVGLPFYLGILLLTFVVGIPLCGRTAHDSGIKDHPSIVWDEFVGMWITMMLMPVTVINIIVALLVFRLFDILKPWPISLLDKHVPGGFGIMLDDAAAGVLAFGVMQLYLYYLFDLF